MASNPAEIMAQGQALVPNYADQQLRRQMGALQVQGQQLQNEAASQQLQQAHLAFQRQQSFGHDMATFVANPTPEGLAQLYGNYPEFQKQASDAWGALDEGRKRTDLTQIGSAAALASKGDYDGAADIVRRRIAADKASGHDSTDDETLLHHLTSSDPASQRGAVAMLSIALGAAAGPEHASEFLKANGLSQEPIIRSPEVGTDVVRIDPGTGETTTLYRNPYVKGADGTIYERTGTGPAPAGQSGGAAAGGKLDPHAFYRDFVLPHEGGYAAHDANGAPVNHGINQSANPGVDVASLTPDQAAGIFADKYFAQSGAANLPPALAAVHADTYFINPKRATQILQQSGGDPSKYMKLRESWMANLVRNEPEQYGRYAKAWATRNQDLRQYAYNVGGGDAAATDGTSQPGASAAPPGLRVVVPGKGREAPSGYRFKPDGSLEAIPGGPAAKQDAPTGYRWNKGGTALEAIPGGPADSIAIDPVTASSMAEQYIAGDKSVLVGLGRGSQGARNIAVVRQEITRQLRAQGMSGRDMAAQIAEFSGLVAGERTLGNRTANIEMASTEFQRVAPLALQASQAASRSGFVPFAKAEQLVQHGTNDTALRRFVAANTSLINVYARAISPTGAPHIADKDHAREMLSTAFDQPSYAAVVDQMQKEIAAARRAPGDVRGEFRNAVSGHAPQGFRIIARRPAK